ncbi:TspO/MBR family protein [Aurantibacter sp.]|uniref:TspO/MBR family protein n=1 Tax=Aurantibacter sp. TaxID=2807103 RepID=UPI0035C80239
MKKLKLFFIFLTINLGSLAIGSLLMQNGPQTDWFINLNQAPWTPPGWVFGTAWTTIMICFSIYLAYLFTGNVSKDIKTAFTLQVLLNIMWNYVFFNQHLILLGLINIIILTVIVYYLFFKTNKELDTIRFLLLPYMIWLIVATSLNAYILLNN